MIINLVLGDWSHDGHGMTETVTIESNFGISQIQKAYKAGVKLLGVDLVKDVCEQYEESEMLAEHYEVFKDSGILDPDDSWIDSDTFAKLYLWTARMGNPELIYSVLPWDKASIQIGGYGLFGS